jgi:uncharacterized protein YecT (DUF1311 family)
MYLSTQKLVAGLSALAIGVGLVTCARASTDLSGEFNPANACHVADPTGTPLNIRTSPYGAIVGNFRNGDPVTVLDQQNDRQGKTWVHVGTPSYQPIGWVYRDYIYCPSNTTYVGPSFNCRYAKTANEQLICGSADLSSADNELATLYGDAKASIYPAFRGRLAKDEAAWVSARQTCGWDFKCTMNMYNARIQELTEFLRSRE